jgi:hypothetical protein
MAERILEVGKPVAFKPANRHYGEHGTLKTYSFGALFCEVHIEGFGTVLVPWYDLVPIEQSVQEKQEHA